MLRENEQWQVDDLIQRIDEIPELSGIYLYLDESTGKTYIGQAINLRQRFVQHLKSKNNRQVSFDANLQQRSHDFYYWILIMGVDPSILNSLEIMYIERYHAVSDGYNQVDLKDTTCHSLDNFDNLLHEYNRLRTQYYKLVTKLEENGINVANYKN